MKSNLRKLLILALFMLFGVMMFLVGCGAADGTNGGESTSNGNGRIPPNETTNAETPVATPAPTPEVTPEPIPEPTPEPTPDIDDNLVMIDCEEYEMLMGYKWSFWWVGEKIFELEFTREKVIRDYHGFITDMNIVKIENNIIYIPIFHIDDGTLHREESIIFEIIDENTLSVIFMPGEDSYLLQKET